jgi:hypothetical protein
MIPTVQIFSHSSFVDKMIGWNVNKLGLFTNISVIVAKY